MAECGPRNSKNLTCFPQMPVGLVEYPYDVLLLYFIEALFPIGHGY